MIDYVLINTVFLLACYFIGSLMHKLVPGNSKHTAANKYANVAQKIFLGLIGIITGFSMYKTNGVTINIIFLIIGALFLLSPKVATEQIGVASKISLKEELYTVLTVWVVLLAFTGIALFSYNYFNTSTVTSGVSPDHYYYSYYASKMARLGIEGTDFSLNATLNNAKDFRAPYHYFDMWLLALLNILPFKLSLANAYGFCFTPMVLSLCWIGLASVYSLFKNKLSVLDFILILFFTLYIAAAEFRFINGINLLNQPKLFSSVICSCIAFGYFYNNNVVKGFLVLSAIAVMNVLALPVVCISGGIISLYLMYTNNKRTGIYLLLSLLIVGLSFIAFYALFGKSGNKVLADNFAWASYLKGGIVYGAKMALRLIVSLALALLLLVVFKQKMIEVYKLHKPLVICCAVLVSVSYIITIFFWNVTDAGQMRAFPGNVIVGLITLGMIAMAGNKNDGQQLPVAKFAYAFCIVFFAVSFVANVRQIRRKAADASVSKSFIEQVGTHVSNGATYGYLYANQKLTKSLWANNPNLIMNNLNYMGLINKDLNKVCLTVMLNNDSIPKGYAMLNKLIQKADLKIFADEHALSQSPLVIAQKEFIVKNNIRYLLAANESDLPAELQSMVATTIKDDKSGTCFFLLK